MSTNKKPVKKAAASGPTKGKPRSGATTASILGHLPSKNSKTPSVVGNRNVKIKPEWAKYYENLLELRERLLHQMNGLAKESAEEMSSYSLHMADSGTDNFDRVFALSLLSSVQDAVYGQTQSQGPA